MEYCVQLLEDGTLVFAHALHNDMFLGIILMSEFRHDYARNYTIPLSSTSYLCPNKTDTAIHSERDGEKEVVNKRKVFPPQV